MTQPLMRQPEAGDRPELVQLGPWFHNLHLPDGTDPAQPIEPWDRAELDAATGRPAGAAPR
jgi:hypothetical protein